ncbi:MAG: type II toxin-antitoxin system VapC family toxin [Chloroflexi bacterium]|nr:type II toxin-antitoxin system VapC family toxin [Chloroflexota bacterium]
MEDIVVDSNILIASFLDFDALHQRSQPYIAGLENESYIFHLPMIVVVEIISALSRRPTSNRLALLARANQSLLAWEESGRISLYPLDQKRLNLSLTVAQRDRLRGADSVVAALAEELGISLKTFDDDILAKFSQAST